jgi:hypothetical protein
MAAFIPSEETIMSPFTIKKNNKKMRIFGGITNPTYKKHRDDEDNKGIPESDTGSGSDSDGGESASSSSVSVSIPQRRRRDTAKGGSGRNAITKKTKSCRGHRRWKKR